MIKQTFKILVLSLILFSTPLWAQTVVEDYVDINSIEVIGVRPSDDVPVTEKTLTAEDIESSYYGQEMTYIISGTPSITTTSDGGHENGYTYFRLRGIDQTRINMTLNGVTLNEPEDQGVYFSNYPNFSQYLESMQVQRGVGTSSNGVASYGGSINFESKDGMKKEKSLSANIGSFNTQSVNANFGSGLINDKFSFFGGASYYTSDGYRYNSGGSGFSAMVSGTYFMKNDMLKLTAFTGKSINQMAWATVPEYIIEQDPKTNINTDDEKDDFNQSFVQLQYVKNINSNSTLTTTAYYNRLEGEYTYRYGLDSIYTLSPLHSIALQSNLYGLMSNYRYATKPFVLNSGFNVNGYNRKHIGGDAWVYENTGYKNDASAYTKAEYKINKFNLYGDIQLRYTTFKYDGDVSMDDMDWLFLNPRGGVSYTMNNDERMYISIGQSHREPTRLDLFGGSDEFYGLSAIVYESVVDYELGYSINKEKFAFNVNVFYMNFDNEITYKGEYSNDGLKMMTNVDDSYRYGIEGGFSYEIFDKLVTNNSTTYMVAEYLNDADEVKSTLYTPNLNLSQDLQYNIGNGYISVTAIYLTKMYIDLDNTESAALPSNFTLNSKVGYSFNKLDVSVNLNNITGSESNPSYINGDINGYGVNCYHVSAPFNGSLSIKYNL